MDYRRTQQPICAKSKYRKAFANSANAFFVYRGENEIG